MEEERKNHNILLTVIGVTTLLVAMIGATFAYFSATATTDNQSIQTGKLKVTANSNIKNNENIKPTDWDGEDESSISDNEDIAVISLTVNTNDTTIEDAIYNIYLNAEGIKLNEEQGLEGGSLDQIKWALFDEDNNQAPIGSGDFGNSSASPLNGKVTKFQVNNGTGRDITITPSSGQDNYKLYIWIQESNSEQNKLQGLTISNATLTVDAKYKLEG